MARTTESLGPHRWRITRKGEMRAVIQGVGDAESLSPDLIRQLTHLATLPGVQESVWALPGARHGGFSPTSVVFVTDPDGGGVVVPSVMGDSLGAGTLAIRVSVDGSQLRAQATAIMEALHPSRFTHTPLPSHDRRGSIMGILSKGAEHARHMGAVDEDLSRSLPAPVVGADPSVLSEAARLAAELNFGVWGAVDNVAMAFDESKEHVTILVRGGHSGLPNELHRTARRVMSRAASRYAMRLPGAQFRCAPVHSHEGREYLAGMAAALNFASANRFVLANRYLTSFAAALGRTRASLGVEVVGDHPAWSIRFEIRQVDGVRRRLCVHRMSAFGPGAGWYPIALRDAPMTWGVAAIEAEGERPAFGSVPAEVSDWATASEAIGHGDLARPMGVIRAFEGGTGG